MWWLSSVVSWVFWQEPDVDSSSQKKLCYSHLMSRVWGWMGYLSQSTADMLALGELNTKTSAHNTVPLSVSALLAHLLPQLVAYWLGDP